MATVATTIKGKRMELRFKLKGLNCPNCAKKIETEIGKLDFVLASNVDIMAQEIALRVNSTVKDSRVKETVCAVVARFEPDVEVIDMDDERDHDHDHGDGPSFPRIPQELLDDPDVQDGAAPDAAQAQ